MEIDHLTREQVLKLLYELQLHQEELEIQNEELIKAHEELYIVHERFVNLYDHAPVGYLTLNNYGIIQEANLTACRMLGIKKIDLIKSRFNRF